MKRILMAGACLVALCGHAHAQLGSGVTVNDPAVLLEQAKAVLQEAKSYALQAQQFSVQAQQYITAVKEVDGFIHDPSLGQAQGLLNQTGLSNSLPVNVGAVSGLLNGYSGMNGLSGLLGKLGQLNGLVNSSYATNHVYSPTDQSWNSQQLIANGNAIAGIQGAAQSAYQDLRTHLPIIQSLQDHLATARDPKDVADTTAALQAQMTWSNNLQSEVQAMDVNYRAQTDSRAQRDNESLDAGIDDFLAQANAAGRGINPQ